MDAPDYFLWASTPSRKVAKLLSVILQLSSISVLIYFSGIFFIFSQYSLRAVAYISDIASFSSFMQLSSIKSKLGLGKDETPPSLRNSKNS